MGFNRRALDSKILIPKGDFYEQKTIDMHFDDSVLSFRPGQTVGPSTEFQRYRGPFR